MFSEIPQVVESDEYYETSSLLGRMVFMTPIFFNFRMRLYTGFVLSGTVITYNLFCFGFQKIT